MAESTPRPWFACDYDPMEAPHIYHDVEGHNHGHDVAQRMNSADAMLIVAAVNNYDRLTLIEKAAQAYYDADTAVVAYREHVAAELVSTGGDISDAEIEKQLETSADDTKEALRVALEAALG